MTERFRNKYRAATTRLYGYDYTRNGAYFVTICSKKHICYFGDIVVVETGLRPVSTNSINNFSVENGNNSLNIKLSEVGKIVNECWFDLSPLDAGHVDYTVWHNLALQHTPTDDSELKLIYLP